MNSSTSSFKTEWKVIAMVLVVLLAAEGGMRLVGGKFSGEIQAIASLPGKADALHQSDRLKVLVLGNSLTIEGIDGKTVQAEFDKTTQPIRLEVIAFHGAFIVEWYHIFKHYFVKSSKEPDIVVIPFNGGVNDHFDTNVSRLALHCDMYDTLEVLNGEINPDRNGELVHSYLSYSFANRARVRQIVLSSILPDYFASSARIQTVPVSKNKAAGAPVCTYELLKKNLLLASDRKVHVIMVAMPNKQPYDLEPQLLETIKDCGATFLDMRNTPDITPECFADRTHLTPGGNKIFSPIFARTLSARLAVYKSHDKMATH